MPVEAVLRAAAVCAGRISALHEALRAALQRLESRVLTQRAQRQEWLRQQKQQVVAKTSQAGEDLMDLQDEAGSTESWAFTGVDRDDPILRWTNLHQPVQLRG